MRRRWLVAAAVVLVNVAVVRAQPAPLPLPAPSAPVVPSAPAVPSATTQPPLLPVPKPEPPLAEVPRPTPQGLDYDPGYQYLPDQLPDRSRRLPTDDLCGPPGRWWVIPSLELAWVPARSAPTNIRLRIPNPLSPGSTLAGPVLPIAGRNAGTFGAALGLSVGHWFDEANTHGIESSFFLRDAANTFGVIAPDAVIVFPRGRGRGTPQFELLPDIMGLGAISTFPATLDTFFTTVDVNYRRNLFCNGFARLDGLVGYRYAFLGDELYMGDTSSNWDAYRQNRAAVSNGFHGGQIGLAGEYRMDGWYVAGTAKLALGATTSQVTTTGVFAGAEARVGNQFRRLGGLTPVEQSEFAVMPTFNLQVGRQVTQHTRLYAGYTFAYLSRVARLSDAINPLNTGLNFTDFWVQSIGLGAEFRF